MAYYSYSRTSELEALELQDRLQARLDNETLKLRTFCLARNLPVAARYQDDACSWTLDLADREDGRRLLDGLAPGDGVVVTSLERIFSNCEDMQRTIADFRKRDIQLCVAELDGDVSSADFCPPFSRMLAVFTNLEKRRAREKIKTVKRREKDKGRFLGGSRPFGYMVHSNGRLIENPMEQRLLKRIVEMKRQGKSLRAISAAVSTPLTPVSFKTVQRLLKRHAEHTL